MQRSPSASRPAAWGAVTAAVAAVLWVAISVESVARPGEHDYRDVLIMLPWVLSMAAFGALHATQRSGARDLERGAYRLVMAAMTATGIGNLGVVLGMKPLGLLAFPLGPLVWIPAMVAWGIGTVRAGVVPRRVGVAIAACQPLTMVLAAALSPLSPVENRGSYTGALANGLALAVIAFALHAIDRRQRELPAPAAVVG